MYRASMRDRLRRRFAGLGDDSGFTLVELIVTMVVIGGMLLGLLAVQTSALVSTTQAKQRQYATALANELLEQARSLPWADASRGIAPTDLGSDPNVAGGLLVYDGLNETLVTDATQTRAPLAMSGSHKTVRTDAAGVQFTARVYVTRESVGSANDALWVTVVVSWASSATDGVTKTAAARSLLSAPEGCPPLATRPFAGPCQAFLYADAGTTGGAVTVLGLTTGAEPLPGLGVVSLPLTLPDTSTGLAAEQATRLHGVGTTSGALALDGAGATVATTGQVTRRVDAGNDPAESGTVPASQTSSLSQVFGTLSQSAADGTFVLTPGSGETGGLVATMVAGSPACTDINGASVSGQPCSRTSVSGSGTALVQFKIPDHLPSSPWPPFTLVSVRPGTAESWSNRYLGASGTTYCLGVVAASAGCSVAGAKHSFGPAYLGMLPGGGTQIDGPSAENQLVTVTNYQSSVVTESGPSRTTAPTLTRSGTVRYVNASGSAVTLALTPTTDVSIPLDTLTRSYVLAGSNTLTVSVTGNLSVSPGVWTRYNPVAACDTDVCSLEASMPSVEVDLVYTLTGPGGYHVQFAVSNALGSATSITSYKEVAP